MPEAEREMRKAREGAVEGRSEGPEVGDAA